MKLGIFRKNKNQKRIVVGSIVGILLLIGSIVLIRSYALYEEEKEFNVLKGQIPDFGYDIKMLSVVVDGEKSKTIPTRGYYKTQIDCSNGTRGYWDYNAWNLTLENVSENARCNITFTSNLSEEEYNKYIEAGKSLRRNTYRGKDITSYHNDGSLYEMISSGRFDDIYVGDYIIANNITWLVADIDNYLYTGDNSLNKHHLTIIPAKPLQNSTMTETNSSEGGYLNTKLKKSVLPNVLSMYISPVFGNHVLNYKTLLTDSVDTTISSSAGVGMNGAANHWEWVQSQLDLMSEVNVFGYSNISSSWYDTGIDSSQYAIFELKPEFKYEYKGERFKYWLKNVSTTSSFVVVHPYGNLYPNLGFSGENGVRPRFLIG